MKRLRRYKLTLLVALLALVSQLPSIYSSMPNWLVIVLLAAIVLAAGYIEYSRSAPALRLEDKRKALLDNACLNAMKRLRQIDSSARLNIMQIDGLYFRRLSYFNIIYDLFVDDDDPDKRMRLWLGQGVCGDAADKGAFCYADISEKKGPTFSLDADQLERTKSVRLVMSMPIKKAITDGTGEAQLTDEIIGVINIDSKRRKALQYYKTRQVESQSLLQRQELALQEISEQCSYLLS